MRAQEPLDQTEFDVIVIGSGAAGFSAALTAAHEGLKVVLFEKDSVLGGTTAISGGAIWVPESDQAKYEGLPDSRDQVLTYLRNLMGNHFSEDLVTTYLDAAPQAISFLEKHTRTGFIPRKYSPDYHSELDGAATGGRTMDTAEFNGRLLGKRFTDIRSPLPQFLALGGMMVTLQDVETLKKAGKSLGAFTHILSLGGRYLMDRLRYPRGTRLVYGNALIASLYRSALDAGIHIYRDAAVEGLIKTEGQVAGVRVKFDGAVLEIRSSRGVILATGGGAHGAQWRDQNLFNPDTHLSMAPKTNSGDGLAMGTATGGQLGVNNVQAAFFAPISKLERRNGETVLHPHLMGDRQMPGAIAVNSAGRRFVNEAASYHEFVVGMTESHKRVPTIPAYLICDRKFLQRYGLGLARMGGGEHEGLIDSGYLIRADTISELASKLKVPEKNLAETVSLNNQYADQGEDPDFGKGSAEYNRYLGNSRNKPNPCLGKVMESPFYSVELWPGDIGTATGLVCDVNARVLDGDGQPINGLYACGNDMNSIMSGFYPGGGITIGPGLTFGYLAAKHIASMN